MNTFTLHLQDARGHERLDGVTSFVGSDESGAFGLMAIALFLTQVLVWRAGFYRWKRKRKKPRRKN